MEKLQEVLIAEISKELAKGSEKDVQLLDVYSTDC